MLNPTVESEYKTERALIAGMIEQEEKAYRQAVTQYQSSMLYLARSIVGEKIADEVVQEAWFSVLKALPKFQYRSKLKTWMLTIVANEAKNRLRKEKRSSSLESLTEDDPEFLSRFNATGHWSSFPVEWEAASPDALLSSD